MSKCHTVFHHILNTCYKFIFLNSTYFLLVQFNNNMKWILHILNFFHVYLHAYFKFFSSYNFRALVITNYTNITVLKYIQIIGKIERDRTFSGISETQVSEEAGHRVQKHDQRHGGIQHSARTGPEEMFWMAHRVLNR